jgi:hypothetical protein
VRLTVRATSVRSVPKPLERLEAASSNISHTRGKRPIWVQRRLVLLGHPTELHHLVIPHESYSHGTPASSHPALPRAPESGGGARLPAGPLQPHLSICDAPVLPVPCKSLFVGASQQVGETHVREPQCTGIRPAGPAMQAQRVRLDGEKTRIENSMMDGAKDETIPGVVGPPCVFGPQVGGIQRLHEVEITHGAAQAIALKEAFR